MKVLVAGWFSFERMGASAGDLLVRDLVCRWLDEERLEYDVAVAAPFGPGLSWRMARPEDYAALLFVCGPFGNGPPLTEFLSRFAGRPLVGVNLTLLQPLDEWNPFSLLLERDSERTTRPDLAFLASRPRVPVAGIILVHPQSEYGSRGRHAQVDAAIRAALVARELAVVPIDTRLDENASGLHTPAQVESLIAKMDVVITTRLHGMVLALKNGVPAVVVDPIAGGAKVFRQARAVGWPHVLEAEAASVDALGCAIDRCLAGSGRAQAARAAAGAKERIEKLRRELVQGLRRLATAGC